MKYYYITARMDTSTHLFVVEAPSYDQAATEAYKILDRFPCFTEVLAIGQHALEKFDRLKK